jgi:hypothetical protein
MRVLFIFICSIAVVSLAPEVHAGKHKDKKSSDSGAFSKSAQKAQAKSADWTKPKGGGKAKNTWNNQNTYSKKEKNWSNVKKHNEWSSANNWNNSNTVKYSKKGKNWSSTEKFTTSPDGQSYHYKSKTKVNTKHFNLSYNPNPAIQSVKFNNNYRIRGSENWKGESYAAFRNYDNEWHDRGWWHSRYKRIGFFSGGWYYWNAGWWYPAWGYAPNAYYAYDGPIYGYNSLTPDQVIANVQATLQQEGYYHGEVDGMLGPLTRSALANYQRAHGLYVTSAIDRPTLESLGMT